MYVLEALVESVAVETLRYDDAEEMLSVCLLEEAEVGETKEAVD